MSELVEKVRAAIYVANVDRFMRSTQVEPHAAIAAVFDWLAVPSKAALAAVDGEDDDPMVARGRASSAWQAMLAEMRKEALGSAK